MSELKAQAEAYFESYPAEGVIHFTSDGQAFFQKNYGDAVNHQRRLDPTVKLTSIYRKSLNDPEGVEDEDDNAALFPDESWTEEKILEWLRANGVAATGEESKDAMLELAVKFVMENDPGKDDPTEEWKNADIIEWLSKFGVETKPNEKKADLLKKVKGVVEARNEQK